ncbi:MAG: DUF5916 domain-containing protein [bacterium]
MKQLIYVVLLLFFFSQQIYSSGGNTSEEKISAVRVAEKISIDGILDEPIWKRPGYTGLTQQEPTQGVAPSQKSEVWVAYDDEAIYFAAKYYDSNPDSILARLVRRDFIWGDPSDGLVLYLDPYNDNRSGYFFYVSAAGTLADGLLENDVKQPNDLTWDAVWEGVPHIDAEGWSVEIKIPYSQLRFNEGESQVWGINVERYYSRNAETDMIAYTPRNESGFASRFPDLVGLEGIAPATGLELLPYVTGKAEYVGNDSNDPFNPGERYRPGFGLDLRTGLGSSLTLNATINPDFGQVEVDPAIVNLSDVEYSFTEKRPFFTEGVSIFRFGRGGTNNNVSFNWNNPNIFYSRRIGRAPQGLSNVYSQDFNYADIPNGTHILGAAKISGQVLDGWKIGTLHAVTQREFADLDLNGQRSSVEIEPLTYYGVFRTQKDFNDRAQGVGILSTYANRIFSDENLKSSINKDAFVLAADGWTFLDADRTYVLTGWAGLSRVTGDQNRMAALQQGAGHYFQRPDVDYLGVDENATSMTGYAGRFMVNKNRGQFTFNTALGFISPKFEINDLGYSSFSDVINTHFYASYRWNEPTSLYQNCGINAGTYANFDFGGNKTGHGYNFGSYITLPTLYGGDFSISYNPESFNARRTRGGPLTLNPISRSFHMDFYTDNRLWWVLFVGGYMSSGDASESKAVYTNVELKVSPTLTIQVGPNFEIDNIQAQWVRAFSDPEANDTYGKRYIFAQMEQTTFSADIRADWIINPTLSFQVYLQPFVASAKYSNFKALQKPKTFDFLKYGENGSTLVEQQDETGSVYAYLLDPDGSGAAPEQTVYNPDFNYISLRGSAVLRWEYLPGSTIYLVWTQSREEAQSVGEFQFGRSMDRMFNVRPDNIFMLKVSYWLGV